MKQLSKEWFVARKGRITGSVAGAALGLSPFLSADDVMRKLVREWHGASDETDAFVSNVVFAYGRASELTAVLEYEIATGRTVADCGFFAHENWLGASPDGLVSPFPASGGIIEIKCPYKLRNGGHIDTIDNQPHYYAQMQVEMFCAGAEWCDFFQIAGGSNHSEPKNYLLERVYICETWLDSNLPKLKNFHEKYIIERELPRAQRHLESKTKEIDTPHASMIIKEYDELLDAIDLAKQRVSDIMIDLQSLSGGESAVICGRKLTKVKAAGRVAYAKAIKEIAPEADLSKWTGDATEYWRLT